MKNFGKIAVLILFAALMLVACGSKDEVSAPVATPEIIVQPPDVTVNVDTTAFEQAVADIAASIDALSDQLDKSQAPTTPPGQEKKEETGGGGDISFDENGFMITTIVDSDGKVLTCGLASVVNPGAPIYQIALDKNGELKENEAGYPILQKAPHLTLDENYVCVESPVVRVDGGSALRLQYAQWDDVLEEWRGLGGDWYRCCFVDFDDVLRETYTAP